MMPMLPYFSCGSNSNGRQLLCTRVSVCVSLLDFQTLESKKWGAVVQRDQGGQECEGPDLPWAATGASWWLAACFLPSPLPPSSPPLILPFASWASSSILPFF